MNDLPKLLSDPNPNIYLSDNWVCLDFETTNLDKGDFLNQGNRVVMAAWECGAEHPEAGKHSSWDLGPFTQTTDLLAYHISKADFVIAANAKFECGWLDRLGIDTSQILFFDVQLAEYTINGNLRAPLKLEALAQKYLGEGKESIVSILISGGVCPSLIPEHWLQEYCEKDVSITHQIMERQRRKYQDLLPCMYTKNLFVPVLADIEKNGMYLDGDRIIPVYRKVANEYRTICAEWDSFTGGINPRSPKQVSEFVYQKLGFTPLKVRGEEVYSVGQDILKQLKPRNKRQKAFLDLRLKMANLEAELNKTLEKFLKCLDDGAILYANFNQTVTRTHRLSSNGKKYSIQFQNFPRKFKPLFRARNTGWKIVEADAAQLEFRAAAFLGQDKQAIEDIGDKVDVHSFTAATLTNAGEPTSRQDAKAHTFKPLYGGSSGTKAQVAYYNAFKAKYKSIADTQEGWTYRVLDTKELQLPTGMRFYWPDVTISRKGYISNTTNIYNYPVQYFATAEIIPIAVTHQWHRMKRLGMRAFLINTIHDSSIGEVPPEEEGLYTDIAEEAYTTDVYNYLEKVYGIKMNVPLEAEVKINDNWSDNDEWKEKWLEHSEECVNEPN